VRVESHKIGKTGQPLDLHLVETDDVVATLGQRKGHRWVVGFALETEDHRLRALAKLEKKYCDLMVSNGPQAISALDNEVEILMPAGEVIAALAGSKESVARGILGIIDERLIRPRNKV
jgi:phosphopantothenoylcysteine decarboxylase/phosphopantothenate--cysteine ligase